MSSADRTPSRRRRAALAALVAAALVGGGTAAAVAVASGDDPAATASARADDRDRDDDAEGGEAAAPRTDVRAAVTAALAKAKGVVASAEFDEDGDRPVWEVEVVGKDGTRTEVLVDPDDGTARGSDRAGDDSDADDDTEDRDEAAALRKAGTDAAEAAGAALKEVPGSVLSVDFEDGRDDGRSGAPAWEVEVIGEDGTEREVLVDAGSGKAALGGADDRDDAKDDAKSDNDDADAKDADGKDDDGKDDGTDDRRED
ncbi:PepSY domain-containing protein [Streptomyces chilikensis]|uniref:PepSY domain-containing protein n=1 Tax=Streptomyces chilikensis TaxID=1194079 RepID=UPI001409680E|nr:PepSY domain-containing protein [Streptomyces chilikensis]